MSKLTKAEQATWDALNKDYNKISWPKLDEMLTGRKPGEYTALVAGRSTGKSQMTQEFFRKMYEGKFE